jgi:hypothetical protein
MKKFKQQLDLSQISASSQYEDLTKKFSLNSGSHQQQQQQQQTQF